VAGVIRVQIPVKWRVIRCTYPGHALNGTNHWLVYRGYQHVGIYETWTEAMEATR
jgi:hypothetical protein